MDSTFDLLDRPIALGGADDVVLRAPAPEVPTLEGRPVTDPRLIAALSVPQEITRAEALDRVAKLGGVLRVLGADGATALIVMPQVPEPARTFAVLAGLRIGLEVVLQDEAGSIDLDAYGSETLTVLPAPEGDAASRGGQVSDGADASPAAPAVTVTVRRVRSHFEDVAVLGGGITRGLDAMMRDARIEPVPARFRDPEARALTLPDGTLTRSGAAEFAASLLEG
ncbi:hypothetical protein [Brevibacterium album]|uniref:hypothetical protein n=1 Tax=Brevibacterium album TaxID=417948 RepID=UPI0003F817C2|nr:hypothetical protein [Brevibacterium album]